MTARRLTRIAFATVFVGLGFLAACTRSPRVPHMPPVPTPTPPAATPLPGRDAAVDAVVAALGPRVRARWTPYLEPAHLAYPPPELALLAFKQERRLEIWARDERPAWTHVDTLPILAASGVAGPKLRQGDLQVPEGIYRLVAFNPRSRFHLSIMVDYPNADDLAAAVEDGRQWSELGGDIFIHGDARSIGCLAIGDRAIEDLFVLVADVGLERVTMIVAPHDPRGGIALAPLSRVPWTVGLYARIAEALAPFALFQ